MNASQLLEKAKSLKSEIIENRRYLHSHAESGFEINNTFEFVKSRLEAMGLNPKKCGKAGITATVGNDKNGKVFMLRADMDALHIKEESGVEFACTSGNMHACGHDMHTSMLLGAAKLLKEYEKDINGTVKLMFQPAEEIFEGSEDMIKSGLLENPKVDAALMIHVMAGMPFEPGSVIVSAPGVSAPAADYFEIKVQGSGCHGSMPNTGVDPISIAAHILLSLQEINAREIAITDKAVLTIGTMNAGTSANAIPDTAVMGGSLRTFDDDVRDFIKKRICDISKLCAEAFRAKAEVTFGSGCPTLVNDPELCKCAEKYTKELLGDKTFTAQQLSSMSDSKATKSAGSEDFAYISKKVPSIMLALAAGQPEKGYNYPQHHPMVKFDEESLAYGSAVYAYNAMRWLEEH